MLDISMPASGSDDDNEPASSELRGASAVDNTGAALLESPLLACRYLST